MKALTSSSARVRRSEPFAVGSRMTGALLLATSMMSLSAVVQAQFTLKARGQMN
jgi:hypothetical protein